MPVGFPQLLVAAGVAACVLGPNVSAMEREPALRVDGELEVVYSNRRSGCDKIDYPDLPLVAVRLQDGSVLAIAGSPSNRAFKGPSLNELGRDCDVVLRGDQSADPAAYDDRAWISSLWTEDGMTIHGLVHNEYHAEAHPGRCSTDKPWPCWYNTVYYVRSDDGGETFSRRPGAEAVVAAPSFPQEEGQGRPRGYMSPSNIVKAGDHWYASFYANGVGTTKSGPCILRTADIADHASWTAWTGADFAPVFHGPYPEARIAVEQCKTVLPVPRPFNALARIRGGSSFVALFTAPAGTGPGIDRSGVYYSVSADLLNWGEPKLLIEVPLSFRDCHEESFMYPSLLDADARTRSFEDVGSAGFLYMTRIRYKDCRITNDRDLVRWPVAIEPK